jgi:hypothetical protein
MDSGDLHKFLEYLSKIKTLMIDDKNVMHSDTNLIKKIIQEEVINGMAGSEMDKLALYQAMSNVETQKLNDYYNEMIKPHMHDLLFEIQPKLELIDHIGKQIKLQQMSQYRQDPTDTKQYLYQIMTETDDKMKKYLEDHSKINEYFISKLIQRN